MVVKYQWPTWALTTRVVDFVVWACIILLQYNNVKIIYRKIDGFSASSKDAIGFLLKKEKGKRLKFLGIRRKKNVADLKEARRMASTCAARLQLEANAVYYCVTEYRYCLVLQRPMYVCREITAEQVGAKKVLASQKLATMQLFFPKHNSIVIPGTICQSFGVMMRFYFSLNICIKQS